MPEARLTLAQAVTYLACSPKSNAAYMGVNKALSDIQNKLTGEVPMHLRDSHYKGAKSLGHGKGYKYPHDYENHYVKQSYMPPGMEDVTYYEPTELGFEKILKKYLENTKKNNK
jgi:putative ATPase